MSPSRDSPASGSSTPKIAIKGFSLSAKPGASKPNYKPQLPSTLGKRPRSTFGHADESDDEDDRRRPRAEVVTGFGEDGAIKERERRREGPLVIEGLKNTSGLGMKRPRGEGMKNILPPEVVAARERAARDEQGGIIGGGERSEVKKEKEVLNAPEEVGKVEWGLSVRKRVKVEDADVADPNIPETEGKDTAIDQGEPNAEEKPKTDDELALAALLGQETKKKGPDLVIDSLAQNERPRPVSEEDAYRLAIASAPEASTLEDYERVPVEEFGAALLRGMGWKGETHGGKKGPKGKERWEVERRPNLLGLGAKELKEAEELGAWVNRSDVKRLKPAGENKGYKGQERKPKVSEYKQEEDRRRRERDERRGGSYRSEREREREYRDDRMDRDRDYDRRDRDRRR